MNLGGKGFNVLLIIVALVVTAIYFAPALQATKGAAPRPELMLPVVGLVVIGVIAYFLACAFRGTKY